MGLPLWISTVELGIPLIIGFLLWSGIGIIVGGPRQHLAARALFGMAGGLVAFLAATIIAAPSIHDNAELLLSSAICSVLGASLGAAIGRAVGAGARLRRDRKGSNAPMASAQPEPTRTLDPVPTTPWLASALPNGWSDDLPALFGRYELRKPLGKGGMATVYLAHDTELDRLVALKIPRFTEENRALLSERFLREARAAGALAHPGLCPIYDVGQVQGVFYFTMAYIDGEPLSEHLRNAPMMPIAEAATLTREVALAMHEAHQQGIIHRDLKPSNIILNQRQQPIVVDFGLAYRMALPVEVRLTLSGIILGTPAYMPPEQAAGAVQALGPACDIYSLGVILYEMLTGRVPFQAGLFGELLAQIQRDPPPPLSEFRPDIPSGLAALCLKALAKNPADRFADMADFAAALTPFTASEMDSAH